MSGHQIRPASTRDAKAIAEIHTQAWQTALKGSLPADYRAALSPTERQAFWREAVDIGEPQVYAATDDDQVVGFVGFDRSRDPNTPQTTGELWALYVAPSHWDRGIGVMLWDAARDGLIEEGCTHVTVWTHLRNERTLRFFELAGFKREMPTLHMADFGSVKLEQIRLSRSLG